MYVTSVEVLLRQAMLQRQRFHSAPLNFKYNKSNEVNK